MSEMRKLMEAVAPLFESSVDMMGKPCKKCNKGRYKETSQHDDMNGVLHCTKCGAETNRHVKVAEEGINEEASYEELDSNLQVAFDKYVAWINDSDLGRYYTKPLIEAMDQVWKITERIEKDINQLRNGGPR